MMPRGEERRGEYLEQAEGRGLPGLVVDVLLSVAQQHLQLGVRDLTALHTLHQHRDALGGGRERERERERGRERTVNI